LVTAFIKSKATSKKARRNGRQKPVRRAFLDASGRSLNPPAHEGASQDPETCARQAFAHCDVRMALIDPFRAFGQDLRWSAPEPKSPFARSRIKFALNVQYRENE
jgi:hypothetical protein